MSIHDPIAVRLGMKTADQWDAELRPKATRAQTWAQVQALTAEELGRLVNEQIAKNDLSHPERVTEREESAARMRALSARPQKRPRPSRKPPATTVYFIEAVGSNRIKIGFTSNTPQSRIKAMSTGCPFEIKLLWSMPGTEADETRLHKRFRADRVAGEWFHASEKLLAFIAKKPMRVGNPT